MSVRGFNTGTGVERYDYNALDNVPLTTNTRVKGDAEVEYREGDVNLTKANIGLGNVDNTSDADKPISTAQQTALDGKVPTSRKVNGKSLSADITLDSGDIGYDSTTTYTSGTAGAALSDLSRHLSDLETRLKSGDEEDADLHLGFYLDENGDLCQVDEEVNNG